MQRPQTTFNKKKRITAPALSRTSKQGVALVNTMKSKLLPKTTPISKTAKTFRTQTNLPLTTIHHPANPNPILRKSAGAATCQTTRQKMMAIKPNQRHSNSQLFNLKNIDNLIQFYRKENHRPDTILIDNMGNNNLNTSPYMFNKMNRQTFESLLFKGPTEKTQEEDEDDQNLVEYENVIFTQKDKDEIDCIVPLDNVLIGKGKGDENDGNNSSILHFDEDDDDDLANIEDEKNDLIIEVGVVPVLISPRSLLGV